MAGYSKIRNEALARALNYMRYIEEWGSGLRRVNKVLGEYGIRAISIEDSGIAVRMNVYRSAPQTGSGPLNEPLNPNAHLKKQGDEPLNGPLNPKNGSKKRNDEPLNEPLKVIYDIICESPGIQAPTIVGKMGKGLTTVKRAISKLKELGKIEFRGSLKTGGYYPIEKG